MILRPLAAMFLVTAASASGQSTEGGFSFDDVRRFARERSLLPYEEKKTNLDKFWQELKYDAHREIEFRRGKDLWGEDKRGFTLQFFHPGWVFPRAVAFGQIINGQAEEFGYDAKLFDYRALEVPEGTPPPPGYAGFKILAPLNQPDRLDEISVFLGASYFRSLAPGLGYGLSARGLALNTARPQGEEFPYFERFWMERPEEGAKSLTFYALMDSASVVGAYKFRIQPGRATVMDVESELTFRKDVELIGIAPFSSMLWYSEITHPKPVDFRPEVHDSDGLLIHYGENDAVWRPLDNSRVVRHSVFSTEKFLGYGLVQRDRDFENYQDLEANYHARPSAFVEPVGTWPAGKVHLIELPTGEEFWDNIVCMWEPKDHPKIGEPFRISYRIHWLADTGVPGLAKVISSRRSHHVYKPEEKKPEDDMFVIDFSPMPAGADETKEPVIQVDVGPGAKLLDKRVQRNPKTGGWRASFRVNIEEKTETLEMACRLIAGQRPASEKWSYLWKK